METVHNITSIVSNPEIRNGRPIIAGTTLMVMDVAAAHIYHGQNADEIAQGYDITLAQAYAALAYYYEHKTDIDRALKESEKIATDMMEKRFGQSNSSLS